VLSFVVNPRHALCLPAVAGRSSISRRPSHFSSTAHKILLPQLLCFDNDPFSWGGGVPLAPHRGRCYPVALQRKHFYPLSPCAVTDHFLHNRGYTPLHPTIEDQNETRIHPPPAHSIVSRGRGKKGLTLDYTPGCRFPRRRHGDAHRQRGKEDWSDSRCDSLL
jgi:hypothetical protein